MADMFAGVTLSTTNYDALLNGWGDGIQVVQSGVSFSGGNSKYSPAAVTARTYLDVTKDWTITDGGPV
jgi:hypothetical protein